MAVGSNAGKTFFWFLYTFFFVQRDALSDLEFQVDTTIIFFMYHAYVKRKAKLVRRYYELSLKACTILRGAKRVGNEM